MTTSRSLLAKLAGRKPLAVLAALVAAVAIAAPVFAAVFTDDNGNNNPQMQLTKPAGVVEGHFMLASITFRGDSTLQVNAPSGWTLIDKRTNTENATAASRITQAVYRKVAGASEPANYVWTFGAAGTTNTNAVGGIVSYDDVDTADPINAFATNPSTDSALAASTSPIAPEVNTTARARIVSMWAFETNATFTKPASMNLVYGTGLAGDDSRGGAAGNQARIGAADVVQDTPGLSGTKTATAGASTRYVAQTTALRLKQSQTITFDQPTSPRTFGDTFDVNPTAPGGPVTVTSGVSDGCDIAPANPGPGYTVTMTSGTTACDLTASQPGSASYLAAPSVPRTVAAQKASQTIDFDQPTTPRTFGDQFNVDPDATSGLDVTVNASGGCSVEAGAVDGWDVEITSGTTDCVLTASQPGNSNYSAATNVPRTVGVVKANQTITFDQPTSPRGFGETFNVNPTAPGGLVTVTSGVSDGCDIAAANPGPGYTVTMTSSTEACVLTASRAGTDDYNAATDEVRTVLAQKGNQTITFAQPSAQTFGTTFQVNPTSSSGLPVSVTSGVSDGCDIAAASPGPGYDVTMTSGTTACVLTASRAGTDDYNAAPDVERTVTAQKASQTITFAQPDPATFGTTFNVNPTSNSLLPVTVTSGVSDGCDIAVANPGPGYTVTMTSGTTACVLTAAQAGNDDYAAATSVPRTVTAQKANQTITFDDAPASATFGDTFNVNPTAPAGAVTVESANNDGCSVAAGATSGWDVTMTDGTKDCELTAKRAGTADYNAAPDVLVIVDALKADQTITFDQPASPQIYGDMFTVAPTATSGHGVTVTSAVDDGCDVSGFDVTMTSGVNDCVLSANQPGNNDYNPAPEVQRTVNAAKKPVTVDMQLSPGAADKLYDGNSSAVVDFTDAVLVDVLPADADVTLDTSGYGATFANKNVGTGKVVTVTGLTAIDGGSGAAVNYTVVQPAYSATGPENENLLADITAKHVTGSFTAANKVYNGNTAASIASQSLAGEVSGDDVDLTGTPSFATKTVGDGKTVTLGSPSLAGADKDNYILDSVETTTTANITAKSLTGSFTAANKVFDGTTAATITGQSLSGQVTGDVVTLTGGTASFADPNPGVNKPVTGAGFALGGTDAGNYTLASVGATTATIRQRGPAESDQVTKQDLKDGAADLLGGSVKQVGALDFNGLAFAFARANQGKSISPKSQNLFAIGCLADCSVKAGKTLVLTTEGGASAAATKKIKLKTQRMSLGAGELGVVKLKLTRKQKKAIKKADKAKLVVKVTVVSGGETVTDKKTYRFKATNG